jgi:hypothetical protein
VLGDLALPVADASECASMVDLLIVATPWPEYRTLSPTSLRRPGRRPFVLDCWRILPAADFSATATLIYPGHSMSDVEGDLGGRDFRLRSIGN